MWYSIKNDFLFLSCCESDIYELFAVEIVVRFSASMRYRQYEL